MLLRFTEPERTASWRVPWRPDGDGGVLEGSLPCPTWPATANPDFDPSPFRPAEDAGVVQDPARPGIDP